MARRLLIVGGVLGLVVLGLVLWLGQPEPPPGAVGSGAASTDDGPTETATPTPEPAPGQLAAPMEAGGGTPRTVAGTPEGSERDERGAMGSSAMRVRDGGLMAASALADPFLYETENERARREQSARQRRWRSLNVVESLIVGIDEAIVNAEAEGDAERLETLQASRQRLVTRRDALQDAIDEDDGPPEQAGPMRPGPEAP